MPQPPKGLNLDQFRKPGATPAATSAAGVGKTGILPAVVSKERRVQAILANIDSLPSLPSVVMEVIQMANNPKSNANDFESSIRKDQALTARMLKLVNSSFYGLNSKINTIGRSVVVLGMKTLKSVVLAASTSKLLDRHLEVYHYKRGGLWIHSLSCAFTARHIATKYLKLNAEDAEELFVGGLLHDIGKIVIAPVLIENQQEWTGYCSNHPDALLPEAETAVAGIDHASAGSRLMGKWQLSERLISILENHHDLPVADASGLHNNCIQLADQLCIQMGMGLKEPYPWKNDIHPALIEYLHFSQESWGTVQSEVTALMKEMQPIFESMRS